MLTHDLRYAVRMLLGNPGFTLVALATLALGIGANTAIFSVIDHVLLRPAPVRDIGRLAVVWETDRNTGTFREPASLPDFLDYRRRASQAEQLAAFAGTEMNYMAAQGEAVRLQALAVTHELLPMLGVTPVAGRGLTAEEASPGGESVVVISDNFWTRALARDPAAIGRTVRLNDVPFRIVGIMPTGADFGTFQILSAADYGRGFADRGARAGVDVWVPLQASEIDPSDHHGGAAARQRRRRSGGVRGHRGRSRADVCGQPCARCIRRTAVVGCVRACAPRLARAAGRGEPRAARRMRQRGEPAPGSRHHAAA
jgi:hypothetical protein